MSTVDHAPVYKGYRIHTSRLLSATYVSMIVRLGGRDPLARGSLTDTVTRVPGEFASEADALDAATRFVDEEESRSKSKQGE